jgi:hypothetical protein
MGAWGVGPFDNDDAGDFLVDLEETDPGERVNLIRQTLTNVADHEDYLEIADSQSAVAAATVLVARLSPAALPAPVDVPAFLAEGSGIEVVPDLASLAVRALDRAMGQQSEWRSEWEEAGEWPTIVELTTHMRDVLSRS